MQVVRWDNGGGSNARLVGGAQLVGAALADRLAVVDIVLADAPVLFNLGPGEVIDVRPKLDVVVVDPERAGA